MTLALVVTVPVSEAELAADVLWGLGVAAIEERTGDHDMSFVELWTSIGDDREAVVREAEAFPTRWRWRLVEVDPAVAESWREHATVTWVESDLALVPAWLDAELAPEVLRVDIDPGAAFGLGDHPTTVLSARLLRSAWWPGASVLDVGTGSGVLAILAARLGAPYVRGIDIAPAALGATRANARRNGVEGVVDVSATPLAKVSEAADIVVANLLAPVLVDLADDLRRVTEPAGTLIISGILAASHRHVLDALAPMRAVATVTKEGWAAVQLRW
ncbi:MAG: 50S ribosomal protein L11 methyltransferase [Desertimonas sp.]